MFFLLQFYLEKQTTVEILRAAKNKSTKLTIDLHTRRPKDSQCLVQKMT